MAAAGTALKLPFLKDTGVKKQSSIKFWWERNPSMGKFILYNFWQGTHPGRGRRAAASWASDSLFLLTSKLENPWWGCLQAIMVKIKSFKMKYWNYRDISPFFHSKSQCLHFPKQQSSTETFKISPGVFSPYPKRWHSFKIMYSAVKMFSFVAE